MSSSEEESDQLTDLGAIRDKMLSEPRLERMQVSGWEDDDAGIEAERNPEKPDEQEILRATENGDIEKVKELVAKNQSLLECTDKDGYTPLHRACYANHVEVVEYLLQAGAKIDAKTMYDWQPLHCACFWNNIESAALLIANGADVNAISKGNQTPLHLVSASSHNSPTLQLLLLHPDTDTTIINYSGDTAKKIATRTGKYYPMFEIIEDCLNII
ncbi:ankyrin repeat domain-containing protein 49 [Colletes latitarsis]|uniref:ankyrin repeat domain-containing protein 49 n=1 Tax=Colletes latitarsis TaxID=2605962 RepID=UPI004034FAC2